MLNKVKAGLVVSCLLFSSLAIAAETAHLNPTYCRTMGSATGKGAGVTPLCDISFTSIPGFSCGVTPQTGTYTITNNSPVTLSIGPISMRNNDTQPAGNASITSTTCGSSLAPGASCNITVTLSSTLPFNRILQVGVNSRQAQLNSPVVTQTVNCTTASAVSSSFPCALNSLTNVATLAGSTITNTGNTVINGNVDLYPGTSITGFPPGVINGTQNIANATALQAQTDATTLFNCLAARPCTATIGTADQSGQTLTSSGVGAVNVYCSGSTMLDSGVLTLSGDATSVFIFNAGSALTMGSGSSIVLTGGATAANVFWVLGSSATLTGATSFQGTIIANQSITFGTGSTILGRALAQIGAVTYDTNTSTLP